ncbi:spermine oxidase-like [Lasioglossum baleicum]|uniref:spermine oxidase-like n=1 Tax=Lasioglossum baleicum TaxID=434251 RepID=UPI003FCEDB03
MRKRTRGWKNDFDKVERTVNASNQAVVKTKLVIVGAGVAGLAAAKTLNDANFKDYLLLEAQSEVGGRIQSIPWNKAWIEGGAQFVHGDQNVQCRDGQGIFIRSNGCKVDEIFIEEVDDFIRTTLEDYEDYENKDIEVGCEKNYKAMFIPPLPTPFSQGIECLGFGLINKIFLDFGVPWWKPGTKGFQLLRKEGRFSNKELAIWTRDLTGFDIQPNHEAVLLGWVGGRGAYIVETLSEQQVATDCENLLKHYLKLDKISPIKRCLRTRWNANKYIRGSYSHITTRCDANGITPGCLSEPIWGKAIGEHHSKHHVAKN